MRAASEKYFEYEVADLNSKELKHNVLKACYFGDLDALKAALEEAPQSINARDVRTGRTPLHVAAALGNYSIVEYLVSQADLDVDAKDGWGKDAFDLAWASGNTEVVRLIRKRQYPELADLDDAGPAPAP